jgi:hypothetical protein
VAQSHKRCLGILERILDLGETLDEPRAPLEELCELLDGQLPR